MMTPYDAADSLNMSGAASTISLQRNALDLNLTSLWQLLHGDATSSGFVGEILLINAVHFRKVGHVGDENLG